MSQQETHDRLRDEVLSGTRSIDDAEVVAAYELVDGRRRFFLWRFGSAISRAVVNLPSSDGGWLSAA